MSNNCINPACRKPQYCRGICTACYQVVIRAIKAGKTTWAKLERDGKVQKRKPHGGAITKRANWLIGE